MDRTINICCISNILSTFSEIDYQNLNSKSHFFLFIISLISNFCKRQLEFTFIDVIIINKWNFLNIAASFFLHYFAYVILMCQKQVPIHPWILDRAILVYCSGNHAPFSCNNKDMEKRHVCARVNTHLRTLALGVCESPNSFEYSCFRAIVHSWHRWHFPLPGTMQAKLYLETRESLCERCSN